MRSVGSKRPLTFLGWLVCAIGVVIGGLLIGSPAANATDCYGGGHQHCYAHAFFDPPTVYMGNLSAHIVPSVLSDGDLSDTNSFVTNEIWQYPQYYDPDPMQRTGNWVETGVFTGWGADHMIHTQQTFYADVGPSHGYHEHYASFGTNLNQDYAYGLHYHGGGQWYIQRGDKGTWGISTASIDNQGAEAAAAGIEVSGVSTSTHIYQCGRTSGLEYQVSGSTVTQTGWPGSAISHYGPLSISWSSVYNSFDTESYGGC